MTVKPLCRHILAFNPAVNVSAPDSNTVVLQRSQTRYVLRIDGSGMRKVVEILSTSGGTSDDLSELVYEDGGVAAIGVLYYHLTELEQHGLLISTFYYAKNPLFTRARLAADINAIETPAAGDCRYAPSKFAVLRFLNSDMILETPLSKVTLTLHTGLVASIFSAFAKSITFDDLRADYASVNEDVLRQVVKELYAAKFLREASDETSEECAPPLEQWEFHDLLFHSRSRFGRHTNRYGGTYKWLGWVDSLPVVKTPMSAEFIQLLPTDVKQAALTDESFTAVLESRRSIRDYGKIAITVSELSDFLFRVARVKTVSDGSTHVDSTSSRPYPGGGARYELELYPIVFNCQGIANGVYHYCPRTHRLYLVAENDHRATRLAHDARTYANRSAAWEPQVLIAISARFLRASWKYESMSYAMVLKDLGALYQTMYLVATAMNLAPCALGGGDSDAFAEIVGTNYYEETSVGEFLLGSKQ